ncbi:MAG: methyltransferase domain-containing protein [Bacteroidota bacterium]
MLYVQYGCGLSAPKEWINFDVSPTLRLQKVPILGTMIKGQLNTVFPKNVKYGDIIKGLPIKESSCDGVYCSHTLEHLSLEDFRIALKNTYKILKTGGIFRCVVPDLEWAAREYIKDIENGNDKEASIKFMNETLLGKKYRPRGLKGFLSGFVGNANHLWMWDSKSLMNELTKAGFKDVRECKFNDSNENMFKLVEEKGRFKNAVAIESIR